MQRAIQTQLYYLNDLRDEPTGKWLQGFLGHAHLDAKGANGQLGGLNLAWTDYLAQLRQAEPFSVTVQLAPPPLTAAQRRNPFLAAAANEGRSYEETIEPARLAATLLVTAECVAREWAPELRALAVADASRAARDAAVPQLYSLEGKAATVRVAGGEGDDQDTPLHQLSVRALHRLCLYRAVDQLQRELTALARGGGVAPAAANAGAAAPFALAPAAAAAASAWLSEYSAEWLPRLKAGAHDEERERLGVAAPGEYKKIGLDGVDAAEALEKLWQARPPSRSEDAPEWFDPPQLATRLYELRAAEALVAAAAVEAFQAQARAGAF